MFKKSLPLALVAIAGCVASVPQQTQKADTTAQTATSAPTAVQSPTPSPTPTPKPTPTPVPTPLPKSILKLKFWPDQPAPPEIELIDNGTFGASPVNYGYSQFRVFGIASSASGDMYIQVSIPTNSIPVLCPACDMNISRSGNDPNYAVFKKTTVEDEFEYVAMSGKGIWGPNSSDPGKIGYLYEREDFTFSKLSEAASVSMAPWVVKSVDRASKKVSFDTAVWPKNTGPLVLSDVASGDFFGRDVLLSSLYARILPWEGSCNTPECEDDRALSVVRERTAFTGAIAYFIGRDDIGTSTTIFRVSESGAKEIVGKSVAAYFTKSSYVQVVHNFVYSRTDHKFYILARNTGFLLYRISEEALVP
ncbi:hypothetical protein HYW94_01530 [Candidatus Uhrbacteria bacterium]|nr:hypothetical protein [Candidatus Uhrbacteria bacterium]